MKVMILLIMSLFLSFCGNYWLASQENIPSIKNSIQNKVTTDTHKQTYPPINNTNQLIDVLTLKSERELLFTNSINEDLCSAYPKQVGSFKENSTKSTADKVNTKNKDKFETVLVNLTRNQSLNKRSHK